MHFWGGLEQFGWQPSILVAHFGWWTLISEANSAGQPKMAAKISNWLGTRSHRSHLSGALCPTFIDLRKKASRTVEHRHKGWKPTFHIKELGVSEKPMIFMGLFFSDFKKYMFFLSYVLLFPNFSWYTYHTYCN